MVMNVYSMETDKQISLPSIIFNSTALGIYVFTNLPFQSGAWWWNLLERAIVTRVNRSEEPKP